MSTDEHTAAEFDAFVATMGNDRLAHKQMDPALVERLMGVKERVEEKPDIITDDTRLQRLYDAAKFLDTVDENGNLPGSVFYKPPRQKTVVNLRKDRSLSGKARRKARRNGR